MLFSRRFTLCVCLCLCVRVWNLTLLLNAIQFQFYYSKVWRTLFFCRGCVHILYCIPHIFYMCVCVFVCLNKSHIINTFFSFCAKTAVPVVEAMNVKWKLCDTFVVCNAKGWWWWWQRWATTMEMETKPDESCASQREKNKSERKCFHTLRVQWNRNAPSISLHVISLHFFPVLFSACIFVINSFFATSKSRCGNKQLFTRPIEKEARPKRKRRIWIGYPFCVKQNTNRKAHNARSDQTIEADREN